MQTMNAHLEPFKPEIAKEYTRHFWLIGRCTTFAHFHYRKALLEGFLAVFGLGLAVPEIDLQMRCCLALMSSNAPTACFDLEDTACRRG